ncbi:MAG: right-handed parallel beta-helix repeat-containing protein [Ignavibacteriaceae bacterium]
MNKARNILFLVMIFSLFQYSCVERESTVLEAPQNFGYTEISGTVSGTLRKSNSPYLVKEDIYVDNNKTLNVEPGTELYFEKNKSFIVNGNLFLLGTKDAPIRLLAYDDAWRGININNSEESVIRFCVIDGTNNLDTDKSAVAVSNSNIIITNSIFSNNASQYGGALNFDSSIVELYNNIFKENYAAYYGGAVLSTNSTLQVINNTFFKNWCDNYGGGIVLFNSPSVIENNIFNNGNKTGNPGIASGSQDFSLVKSNYNFLSTDVIAPGFISEDDLHLHTNSPCRNAGNPAPEYNDSDGTQNDQGAYGGPLGDW